MSCPECKATGGQHRFSCSRLRRLPLRTKGWVIERDDRQLYAGDADHTPRWGVPAVFATQAEAIVRHAGLGEQEPGRRFHVRPFQGGAE